MKRLIVIGQVPPALLHALSTRFLVEIIHRLMPGDSFLQPLLRDSQYQGLLIGSGVDRDAQTRLFNLISLRTPVPVVGVLGQSQYSNWTALSPTATGEQVAQALRLEARKNPAQVIMVLSTKGGVGKSNVAANVALALANFGGLRVALIDDDMTSRSVRPILGIEDTQHNTANLVADIQAQDGVITPELLSDYLLGAHGVWALVGPRTLLSGLHIHEDVARNLLAIIGNDLGFDAVVIDAPPDFQNSSSFTYGLLRYPETSPSLPIALIPTIPEKYIFMSVEDTLAVLTHARQPLDRIWPVINCLRPTHDPEMLRGHKLLWRDPAGIIPYCPELQFVGERNVPALLQPTGSKASDWLRRLFGSRTATLGEFQTAYRQLAEKIIRS